MLPGLADFLLGKQRDIWQQRRGKLCLAMQELQGQTCTIKHTLVKVPARLTISQKEHSANIKAAPQPYPQQDTPKKQNIIEIDCRGLEFLEFKPDGEWQAVGSESGSKFSGIDLTDGEWYDYDEKAGDEVSIKELKWEIKRA